MNKVITILIVVGVFYFIFKMLLVILKGIAGFFKPNRYLPADRAVRDYYEFDDVEEVEIEEERWVSPGEQVSIHGKTIEGGMLYIQSGPSDRYGADPSLINVDLPRSPNRPCTENYGMSYWPSYSDISAEARSAYMDWLEKGRRVKGAYIGYVFLFFYGLERRILVDDPSEKEIVSIRDEVNGLLSLYGDNRSFRSYAENFLGLINVTLGEGYHKAETNPNLIARGIYSPSFKVELGKLVVNKNPIPWDLALEWSLRDPETKLRVPAKRCPKEFASVFEELYRAKYGEGMVVPPNKKKIELEYHPASSALRGVSSTLELPDPSGLKGPVNNLLELVEQSMAELDPYSRLVGKDPESAMGISGISLLPNFIASKRDLSELKTLRKICQGALAENEPGILATNDLLEIWPTRSPEKFIKSEAVQLANVLALSGFGIEPDPRYGGKIPSAGEEVAVFNLLNGQDVVPGQGYHQAVALVQLAGLVASADGDVSLEERTALNSHLASALELNKSDSLRLTAFFEWIVSRPASMAGLKAKLGILTPEQRDVVADFLITVAGADGVIHPKEIKMLEKVYKTMGMDPSDVQIQLHRFIAGWESQPVTVKEADSTKTGYSIPADPGALPESEVVLDVGKLQLKREQTKEVAGLLEDVFAEEAIEPEPHKENTSDFYGLDVLFKDLLEELGGKDVWDRDAFDALAAKYHLMPSGVVESLNEVALDNFEDEVLFDEENIEINREVLEEMLA